MIKKCLTFLLILSISYLCPINSKAQSELNQAGPAKDTCICYCSRGEELGPDGLNHPYLLYFDNQCTDKEYEYADILTQGQCENKNGQFCRGHLLTNAGKCLDGYTGKLVQCNLISVPDNGG